MTEIRIRGDLKNEVLETIKAQYEILETNDYNDAVYCIIKDPLQKISENNLQDWMIIEYCKEWRTTPEIMKYFKLEYDTAREILDRLYASEALGRRLEDKRYAYIDRDIVHRCKECVHFIKMDEMEIPATISSFNNGRCEIDGNGFHNDGELNRCEDYDPKQKVIA